MSSIKRIELESLRRMLKNQKLRNLSEIINNEMIQRHKTNLETLEVEQARLSTIFKPNHPRMLELGKQITESHQRLNLEVAGIVRRIESDYAVARQREESLKLEAERQKKAAINLKELGVKYTILQEEVDSNRNLYTGILTRVNETKISNDLPVSNMQLTETAGAPGVLSSRRKQLKLLLATAFGALFLAVGLAFFLAYCDSTVRTPEDVWRDVSLNTLGIVPDMRTLSRRLYGYNGQHKLPVAREAHRQLKRGHSLSKELIVSQHPLSITSESYYTIRTALLRLQPENPPQAILLTSPSPHEGKTLTTLNLGISLAQAGYAVLVMDADLHQGICHKMLGLKNHKGLSNILTGNLTLEEGIQKAPIDGLSLLSRGVLPRNPADLVGSNKMKEVMDLIRASFDFIMIDSPPVNAVTDAAVLSAMSDGVLLVLNGRETKAAAARHAIERLAAVRANVLGVVLNGVDIRNPDYTDYRSYYTAYTSQSKEKADI